MVGTPETASKTGDLMVTPYPVFLCGAPGTEAKLAAEIKDDYEPSTSGSIVGYAQVRDAGHVGIDLRNTTAKLIHGTVTINTASGSPVSSQVQVASGKTAEILLPFKTATGGISSEDLDIRWKPSSSTTQLSFPAHIESYLCARC